MQPVVSVTSNLAPGSDAERRMLTGAPSWVHSLTDLESVYVRVNAYRAEAKGSPARRLRFLRGCRTFAQFAAVEVSAFEDAQTGERCWYLSYGPGEWVCRLFDDSSVCTGIAESKYCTYDGGPLLPRGDAA